jgi:hypothetical protein
MKKNFILSLLLILAATSYQQVLITRQDNAFLTGDSVNTREIQFMSPGDAGPGQVWDFSQIRLLDKNTASYSSEMPAKLLTGLENTNLVFNDHGYQYFMHYDENKLEELGLLSKDYYFVFSDPMLKMKYPFCYGESFSDSYGGTGFYRENKKVEVAGTYTVTADGYGSLILPDRVLKNAMRLRIEETGVQMNPCNSIERNILRYMWFVPKVRYAVLGFTTSEYTATGQLPNITYSAFINPKMCDIALEQGSATEIADAAVAEPAVVIFPNPFTKKLSYNYYLSEQIAVSVELMDISGRRISSLLPTQIQLQGMHSSELDASDFNLGMGVYYLRFTFGKKVVMSKVVKM